MVQYIVCITENCSPIKLEISKLDKKSPIQAFFALNVNFNLSGSLGPKP